MGRSSISVPVMPAKPDIKRRFSWIPALRFAPAGMTVLAAESSVGTAAPVRRQWHAG
jgi:hypothetical protein